MKTIKKISLVIMVFTLLVAVLSVVTSAKTYTGSTYGGKSDYIYVKTTAANAKIPLTFAKGALNTSKSMYDFYGKGTGNYEKNMYASYEVKVSYWNGSKYILESNYDIYDKSSYTITLKQKNKDYKIQIYQWTVGTTLTSYINKGKYSFSRSLYMIDNPFWRTLPKYSTGTLNNCKFK